MISRSLSPGSHEEQRQLLQVGSITDRHLHHTYEISIDSVQHLWVTDMQHHSDCRPDSTGHQVLRSADYGIAQRSELLDSLEYVGKTGTKTSRRAMLLSHSVVNLGRQPHDVARSRRCGFRSDSRIAERCFVFCIQTCLELGDSLCQSDFWLQRNRSPQSECHLDRSLGQFVVLRCSA